MAGERVTKRKVVFEDPGDKPARGPRNPHMDIAEQLRARPGEWGQVGTYGTKSSAYTMGSFVRLGKKPAYTPAGAYEATVRVGKQGIVLYARYVGEEQEYA